MIDIYFIDEVKVIRRTKDKWGEESEESTTTYKGRVNYKHRLVRDNTGSEVVSEAEILLNNIDLKMTDILEVNNSQYAIINIAKERDFDNCYLRVMVR